jgi:23S rRNA (adenine2503-C2)-methyltransferase
VTTPPLQGLTLSELGDLFAAHGVSQHQARMAFQALHRSAAGEDFAASPSISPAGRAFLKELSPPPRLLADAVHAAEDGTIKLRLKTPAGDAIEAVLIPAKERLTLCVSSQVGCAAACSFCHTGTMGLLRNLEAWEIVEQVRAARKHAPSPITNLVFMGMGEPLHNEANVIQACRILNDDVGAAFSRRHIVVSTAGVGNRIRPLWEEGVASLAVSLHATTDDVRNQIVPLNKQWNLAELKKILLEIPWRNRESLTVAYLLLAGVNDTREDAQRLAEWSAGLPAKINLLEFNPFPGSAFKRSGPEQLAAFRQWLHDFGVFNTLRHSRGDDVMAACGQLATDGRRQKAVGGKQKAATDERH